MKKQAAVLAAAVLCLALAGCGKSDAPATTAAVETTMADTTMAEAESTPGAQSDVVVSYKLSVPQGFEEVDADGFEFYCIAADNSNINMNVQDKDPTFSQVTVEMMNEGLTQAYNQIYGKKVTINDDYFKTDMVSGFPAYQYSFSYELDGVQVHQLVIGVDADCTYTFTYTDMTGEWMDAFEESAKTIQLITE
jgi:hypothetical protein